MGQLKGKEIRLHEGELKTRQGVPFFYFSYYIRKQFL